MTPAEIVAFVIDTFEGWKYTDDPVDTGGATKFGITLRTLQYYRRLITNNPLLVVTKADVAQLTHEEAVACGLAVFFVAPAIDALPDWRLQLAVYDYGFHSGEPRAITALQSAIALDVADQDGVIGPQTLAVLAAQPEPLLVVMRVLTSREEFMQDLMDRNATQRRFMFGWWRRTTKLQRVISL